MRIIDLVGQRFTRLVVTGRAPNKSEKDTNARWHCTCDCGKAVIAYGQDLRREKFKSCGCLNAERIYKHGDSRSKEYRTWITMRQRCENPNAEGYEKYGAKGIKVCERWASYENFKSDMGECPTPRHTIDRIDGDKGYEPENCRWATYAEQNRNLSNNVVVDINGVKNIMADWCVIYKIRRTTVETRIKNGWDVIKAIKTPVGSVGVNLRRKAKLSS